MADGNPKETKSMDCQVNKYKHYHTLKTLKIH